MLRLCGYARQISLHFAILAGIFVSHTSRADEKIVRDVTDDSKPLVITKFNLSRAIEYAKKNNPDIRLTATRIRAARAFAAIPKAQWLPRAGAAAQIVGSTVNNSTATILSNPMVDLPRIGATTLSTDPDFTPHVTTAVAVGLRQEIFDFGRIAAETAAAEAQVRLERLRADSVEFDVTLQVTETFYSVRAARAIATTATDAAKRAALYRDATRASVNAGLRTPVDLARAEAEAARFEVSMVRAQSALDASRAAFAAIVGLDEPALDVDDNSADATDAALPSVEELVARARGQGLDVLQAEVRVAQSRAETNAAAAQLRPNLFLTASISTRAGGAPAQNGVTAVGHGFLPVVPNYSAGVVLSVPIYDATLLARRDALRQVENTRAAELETVRFRQAAIVRQAYLSANAARQALAALERAEAAAKANHAQAEARYAAGLGTILDLIDAETLRVDAEMQRAIGAFQAARARALLERTIAEVPR